MRYYSTQRPVSPGTFPKPAGNRVLDICNYDCRIYCVDIGREAWGYIDYEHPLPPEQAANYELISATSVLSSGSCVYQAWKEVSQ